ncbi:MAG: Rap1a/Tai family immunity protein [Hyphomicrobiales bacterium]
MKRLFFFSFLFLSVLKQDAFAFEDRRTVELMLIGCRFHAQKPAPVRDAEWGQSFECRDALRIIVADGRRQPKFLASCIPESVTEHEIARAVVQILERNPERFKERFDIRATAALHEAWPCPN